MDIRITVGVRGLTVWFVLLLFVCLLSFPQHLVYVVSTGFWLLSMTGNFLFVGVGKAKGLFVAEFGCVLVGVLVGLDWLVRFGFGFDWIVCGQVVVVCWFVYVSVSMFGNEQLWVWQFVGC